MMELVYKALDSPNPDLRGNIILMHDSGGDRSKTLVLLPQLIDSLRAKGYQFVPVSELVGKTRDEVMPRLPLTMSLYADRAVFLTISYLGAVPLLLFPGRHRAGRGAAVRAGGSGAVEARQGAGHAARHGRTRRRW